MMTQKLKIQLAAASFILFAYALAWIMYGFPMFLIILCFGIGNNLENAMRKNK